MVIRGRPSFYELMEIYPAIDIKGGRVVRMLEGARVAEHGYGADPLAQAS